jgi:D-serine deaminase-like pyridoxal phosphate-dependent protein
MIGVEIDDLETPALVVDLDRMEKNIRRMVKFTRECGVELRPHVKTHKVPDIAKMQLDAGSRGVCLQKVSEVEVFAWEGIDDIFLTNEVVVPEKLQRLASVAEKAHVGVAVDDLGVVMGMGRIFKERGSEADVYVDVDVGMHRCGLSDPAAAANLARAVSGQDGLVFKGLMGYEGNVNGAKSKAEQVRLAGAAMSEITDAKDAIEKAGMKVDSVSVGSSVSTWINAKHPAVTEVQPGMYIFNDHVLVDRGVATWEDCALTVVTTVMSKPAPNRAVVDAGSKAFNFDTGLFPVPLDRDGVRMTHFSEEHGWLELKGKGRDLKVGDRISFVPAHCCTTINQFEELSGVRKGKVDRVFRVLARGKMT